MYDLCVIGGGYWGTAIAYRAQELGLDFVVIDSGDPKSGSRNASAICDPGAYTSSIFDKYWPKSWERDKLKDSIDWLETVGGYWVQEYFQNDFAGTEPRERTKVLYLSTPHHFIQSCPKKIKGQVCGRKKEGKGQRIEFWAHRQKMEILTKSVVVAAGYRSDEVLNALGVPGVGVEALYGRGLNCKGSTHLPTPLSLMIKPYVKHTIRTWANGLWKVGDTCEVKPSESKFENLKEVGRRCLSNFEIVEVTEGYRPSLTNFTVRELTPGVVLATGGHRLGLGLSRLVAEEVEKILWK